MDDQEPDRREGDPSPEEIRRICDEIQREWTRKTQESRLVTKPRPWIIQGAS